MAKIQTARFSYSDENNNYFEHKADVNVSADGLFSLRIPEFLARFIDSEVKGVSASKVSLCTRATGNYAQSKVLDSLLNFVKMCFNVYSAPDVQQELVILYRLQGTAAIWQNLDRTLRPNGTGAPDGEWCDFGGSFGAANPPQGFGVNVTARVRVRVTKTRGLSVTHEYAPVSRMFPNTTATADLPGATLNSFICCIQENENTARIPYTPEAEQFFVNLMLSTADLARRVAEFGASQERVLHAIANGSSFIGVGAPLLVEHKPAEPA